MAIDYHILIKWNEKNIMANPYGYTGERPTKVLDMALATTQQTQDMLEASGFTDLELIEMTPQIGVMQQSILDAEEENKENRLARYEADFIATLYASMIRACMEHKGVVSEIGILQASEKQLPEFAEQYQIDARENFDQQVVYLETFKKTNEVPAPISSPKYAVLYRKFDRIAELLWMTKRRLGEV